MVSTVKSVLVMSDRDRGHDGDKRQRSGSSFELSQANSTSRVIDVFDNPKRLIAWGLKPGDKVIVRMVRVGSTGPENWSGSENCCIGPTEPGDVVVIDSMPYERCGRQVVLTDQSPTSFIDDAGMYVLFFESSSSEVVIIDAYDDIITRKTC